MRVSRGVVAACTWWMVAIGVPASAATNPDDYVAGYAAAVAEREFGLKNARIEVKDGHVIVIAADLPVAERDRLVRALEGIEGVRSVELRDASQEPSADVAGGPAPGATQAVVSRPESQFLPKDKLWKPLLADPRWPHFSISYLYYHHDPELKSVGSATFGETFPIYRSDLGAGQWELGFQAAVFAIFDMDSTSHDLVNADYWAGIPLTYQIGCFSLLGRVFHQSSHLGDEFLLRNRTKRVNLTYESFDLLASVEVTDWLRVYGGGGWLFDQEPDLDPWSTEGGVELESPIALFGDHARPIAGIDVKNHQENDWNSDVSIRGGFQLEAASLKTTKLQILGEYFDGHSPNGQFYERKIEYYGLGAHVLF